MSSLFQGLADPDGRVRVTTDPTGGISFRGLLVNVDAVVAEAYDGTQDITWIGGVGVTDAGHLLISTQAEAGRASGGLAVDADGIILISEVVTVFHQGVGLDGIGRVATVGLARYLFNGTDMYAIMGEGWAPLGFSFSISADVEVVGIADNNSVVGRSAITGDGDARLSITGGGFAVYTALWSDTLAAPINASSFVLTAAVPQSVIVDGTPTGLSANILNETPQGSTPTNILSNITATPLELIGAYDAVPTGFWDGYIWNLKLTDNSPLHGRNVMFGNGVRYGVIPLIQLAGDLDISFSWIREDNTGTTENWILGEETASFLSSVGIRDTGHATEPDAVVARKGVSEVVWANAFANIAIGQHVRVRITSIGADVTLYVDGVADPVVKGVSGTTFTAGLIGASGNIFFDGAIGDIVIIDKANLWVNGGQGGPKQIFINGASWDTDHYVIPGAATVGQDPTVDTFFPEAIENVSYTITYSYNVLVLNDLGQIALWDGDSYIVRPIGLGANVQSTTFRWTGDPTNGHLVGLQSVGSGTDLQLDQIGVVIQRRWDYALDEGVGLAITNDDPTTNTSNTDLPFYDQFVNMGNAARFGEIPDITIPAGNFGFIEYSCIRQDRNGTSSCYILSGPSAFAVSATDTGAGNAVALRDAAGSTETAAEVLADIPIGGHYTCRMEFGGTPPNGVFNVYINGELKYNVPRDFGDITFTTIGINTDRFPVGSAIGDVVITDTTAGITWNYPCDEGTGTVITNKGTTGAADNGTWNPDTDWQYIQPFGVGQWTPDTDWVDVETNSRSYPMQGGLGDTFPDVNHPDGSKDAVIQNFDPANWEQQ